MNSYWIQRILISEFIYLWIIDKFRIHTFEFIHMNSYTHEFMYSFHIWIHTMIIWIHMYMNSHTWIHTCKLWIHMIFSYICFMNSYMNSGAPRFQMTGSWNARSGHTPSLQLYDTWRHGSESHRTFEDSNITDKLSEISAMSELWFVKLELEVAEIATAATDSRLDQQSGECILLHSLHIKILFVHIFCIYIQGCLVQVGNGIEMEAVGL